MQTTIYVYSVVNFLSLVIFAFVSVYGLLVMYAINEVVKNELQHIQVNLHLHKNFFIQYR